MNRDLWTTWDWRAAPTGLRTWEHSERRVVLIEDHLAAPFSGRERMDAGAYLMTALHTVPVIFEESCETLTRIKDSHPFGPCSIPALHVERQADLSVDALHALCAVKAEHRALVVTPREETDIREAIMGYVDDDVTGGRHVRLPHQTPRIVQERMIDLVVVRGPTGSKASPMSPAWVRSVRDQCVAAGVAFAFLGWGRWTPGKHLHGLAYHSVPDGTGRAATFVAHDHIYYELDTDRVSRHLDGVEHLALPGGS